MHFTYDWTPEQFAKATSHWLAQVARYPKKAIIAGHAGIFLSEREYDTAFKLLNKAVELDPDEYYWAKELVFYHGLRFQHGPEQDSSYHAQEIVKAFEKFIFACNAQRPGYVDKDVLGAAFYCAFWLNDPIVIRHFTDLVKQYGMFSARNFGHTTWGLLALRENLTKSAKRCLNAMAKRQTLSQMDWRFVQELLDSGEKRVIINFLEKRKQIDNLAALKIDEWITAIKAGEKPNLQAVRL